MTFSQLRFEAAKLNMEIHLEFPVKEEKVAYVGKHRWESEHILFGIERFQWTLQHDDPYRAAFKMYQIPNLWRKVNGVWQIVY